MRLTRDDFFWDGFFWSASLQLPDWPGATLSAEVTLTFAPEGREEGPLQDGELALLQWLVDHHKAVGAAALDGVLQEYPRLQALYAYPEEEAAEIMPGVSALKDLVPLVQLHSVNVHQVLASGLPYVGLEFRCAWDVEHGAGVLMHGTRVVKVGGADTAILLWIAEDDAKKLE